MTDWYSGGFRMPKGQVWAWIPALAVAGVVGCGDGSTGLAEGCVLDPLPLEGQADAPTVTDVWLEDQGGERIVVHVTATDPQGSTDLVDVIQTVGVFRGDRCEGPVILLQDDLAGSGIEESFGTAVDRQTEPALYEAIAESQTWPVELEVRDAGDNVSSGRVGARVVR